MPLPKHPPGNPWTTTSRIRIYDNPWIKVEHHAVVTPTGTEGIYGHVHFKNQAIGIVPLGADGYTYLVGQWRYTLNEYHWEIPAGGCPLGTDSLATAQRELLEETGLVAKQWTPLLDFHLSNSVTDEYGVAYLAEDLTQDRPRPDETEELLIHRLPLSEAIELTLDGTIKDGLSILALQRLALRGVQLQVFR